MCVWLHVIEQRDYFGYHPGKRQGFSHDALLPFSPLIISIFCQDFPRSTGCSWKTLWEILHIAFIFTCNFLKMPDCRFQGMKGKELLFCQFKARTRQIYMCWVLRTAVRDNCCHSFERQQPQMMQLDISGLYTAQSGLPSCHPVTRFIKAWQKKEKRCEASESSSLCSLLTQCCLVDNRSLPSLPRSLPPFCVLEDYTTEHSWQLQISPRQRAQSGGSLFGGLGLSSLFQEGDICKI